MVAESWSDTSHVFTTTDAPHSPHRSLLVLQAPVQEGKPVGNHLPRVRHTCATLMAKRNVHPNTVKAIMGHEEIRTTLGTYSQEWPSIEKDASEGLADVIF